MSGPACGGALREVTTRVQVLRSAPTLLARGAFGRSARSRGRRRSNIGRSLLPPLSTLKPGAKFNLPSPPWPPRVGSLKWGPPRMVPFHRGNVLILRAHEGRVSRLLCLRP